MKGIGAEVGSTGSAGARMLRPLAAALLAFLVLGSLGAGPAAAAPPARRSRRHGGPLVSVKVARRTSGDVLVHWRNHHALSAATIRLDGRLVRAPIPFGDAQRAALPLDPADGLHFGRNRIVVRASSRHHRQTRLVRRVFVARSAPLPAIVQPHDAVTGTSFRVDGRHSMPAHGGRLTYRWQVVRAPRGAKARLRGASSRRPYLIASVPGRYRLALTVDEAPRKGRGKAAEASAVECAVGGEAPATGTISELSEGPLASAPLGSFPPGAMRVVTPGTGSGPEEAGPQASAGAGCATDVENVEVQPAAKPIGVAFDSRAVEGSRTYLRVGTEFIPLSQQGVTVAVYEAQNLQPLQVVQHEVPIGMDAEQLGQAVAAPYVFDGDVLIVVTGLPGCCSTDPADSRQGFTLVESYSKSGGTTLENEGLPIPPGPEATGQTGEMGGWLQKGIPIDGGEALYTFVSPERVPFETSTSHSATSNTMTVGGRSFPVTLPSGTTAGFEVLVTNAELRPIDGTPTAFGTDAPVAGTAAGGEEGMAKLIGEAATQPGSTVFVQSIGDPTPSTADAVKTATELQTLGASPWVFLSQDGAGPWAFVGNTEAGSTEDLKGTTAEASAQWSRQAGGPHAAGGGTLDGLLRRNDLGALAPQVADSVGTPNFELEQVTYQEATPWPGNAGELAATRWFAETLKVGTGAESGGDCWTPSPSQPEFQAVYCNQNENLVALRSEVSKQAYQSGHGFGPVEFEGAKRELETQILDVETVRGLFKELREPLGAQDPAVDSNKIAGKIIEATPAPKKSAVSGNLGLAGSIFDAAAYVPAVGEVLGPIGSILDMASQLTQEEGLASPDWKVQTSADAIGGVVEERLRKMTGELGETEEIIDSDWGKLSATAADAGSRWGVDQRELAAANSTVELGISQWMWAAIAPAAFQLVGVRRVAENSGPQIFCSASYGRGWWYPWRDAASESVFYPLSSFEGGRATSTTAFGMIDGSYEDIQSIRVDEALGQAMFASPSQGGAGLGTPWFFEHASWTTKYPKYERGSNELPDHFCGTGEP
jgi:hypothetical protein